MSCSRRSNSLVKYDHESALKTVYEDQISSILRTNPLLIGTTSKFLCKKQMLENNISTPLIDDIFQFWKSTFNRRHFAKIENDKKASLKLVLGTISYRAPELWNLLPAEIKRSSSLSTFKEKINA